MTSSRQVKSVQCKQQSASRPIGDDYRKRDKVQDNPAQLARSKDKKINNGASTKEDKNSMAFSGNFNGANLLSRYKKAYGDDAVAKMKESVKAFRTAGGQVKENFSPGQYGYSVQVKIGDKWVSNPDEVNKALAKYAPAASAEAEPQKGSQQELLAGMTSGGTTDALTKRFARAYGGGDLTQGQAKLDEAIYNYRTQNPNKIRVFGKPGETGAYIQVKVDGKWTNNSDIVAKTLAGSLNLDQRGETATPVSQLNKNQQALLSGANGNAVLNRLNFGAQASGADALQAAIKKFENANPGNDIRVHGNPGEAGFYIEIKTQNGWTSDTGVVTRRLARYMPASSGGQSGNTQAPDPNSALVNPVPATQQPGSSESNPNGDLGPQIGIEAGSPGSEEAFQAMGAQVRNVHTEQEAFRKNKPNVAEVDLGTAARKSEAMMAFDLNGNGKISKAEKTLMANGDQNNNGIVGEKGLNNFVATADTNNSGLVSQVEVKAYNVLDTNGNNKIGAREVKAYGNIDTSNDGDISKKEARAMVKDLRAQVDLSKQEKKDLDLAQAYLAKSGNNGGGAQQVDEQVAALVNAQPKHNQPKDDDGPGKKKNKK